MGIEHARKGFGPAEAGYGESGPAVPISTSSRLWWASRGQRPGHKVDLPKAVELARGINTGGDLTWEQPAKNEVFLFVVNRAASDLLLGEPTFGLDRGLAAHTGSGDRLTVNMILTITGDIDPGDIGEHLGPGLRFEIAASVNFERRGKWTSVGDVADGDENAFYGQHFLLVGFYVFHF